MITLVAICTSNVTAQEKPEFRGVWISAWQGGLLTPAQVDESIRLAKLANMNALVVQVRKAGDAYYKSAYEPRGENLSDPDYDPLAYIIEKAHAAGLEVHAWFNTYKIWQGKNPPKSPQHMFNRHKEWINKSKSGRLDKEGQYALDPGIPEVQQHIHNVVMDVVRKYDVDGIHFDYVRYWERGYGYSDAAVARFNKETGRTGVPDPADPQWSQWRRDCVTDLVRQVYNSVKETKPEVKVTAAVICSRECAPDFKQSCPYEIILQDWEGWLREGIVDAVIPMNYRSEDNPTLAKQFREWTSAMSRWKHGRHIYNGLIIKDTDDFITQISESRKLGMDGICGFAFNVSYDRQAIAQALRKHVSPTPVPTPTMPWKTEPETPPTPDDLIKQAAFTEGRGGTEAAINLLMQALDADPDSLQAHYRLGTLYAKQGMKDEAATEFKQVLKLKPSHGGALLGLKRLD